MARVPNTESKEMLLEMHRAKMHGKKLDRARRDAVIGQEPVHGSRRQVRKAFGFGSLATGNRNTGKPHENAREIARAARRAALAEQAVGA